MNLKLPKSTMPSSVLSSQDEITNLKKRLQKKEEEPIKKMRQNIIENLGKRN